MNQMLQLMPEPKKDAYENSWWKGTEIIKTLGLEKKAYWQFLSRHKDLLIFHLKYEAIITEENKKSRTSFLDYAGVLLLISKTNSELGDQFLLELGDYMQRIASQNVIRLAQLKAKHSKEIHFFQPTLVLEETK